MPGGEAHRLVQEEQLGVVARSQQPASSVLELGQADDPASLRTAVAHDAARVVVEHAPVAEEQASPLGDVAAAPRIDPVGQWHGDGQSSRWRRWATRSAMWASAPVTTNPP